MKIFRHFLSLYWVVLQNSHLFLTAVFLIIIVFRVDAGVANELSIRPGISIQELYTDNISLSPKNQKNDAFITEVSPYVVIQARGARNRVNAALRVENLFFHGINKSPNTFFQGQFESRSRVWANSFFVDLRGTHTQANTRNRGRIALDNISQAGGRVDVSSYTISPFWRMQLGGYAKGEARVSFSDFRVNNDDNNTNVDIADARIHEEKFNLSSSRKFDMLGWKLDLSNREENRRSGNTQSNNVGDIRYFNTFGEINFKLVPRFIVFVRAGYADNDLGTLQLNSKNGVYYQIGGRWRPSSAFQLSAAGGNNNFIKLAMRPFQRAKWEVGYQFNSKGLNTGSQWNTRFQYKSGNFLWRAGYRVDTVSTQQVLLARNVFAAGAGNINRSSGLVVNNNLNELTSFRNQVFERKRAQISLQGNAGKNIFRVTAYNEERNFDNIRQNEDAQGALLSWLWRFNARTSSVVTANIERIDGGNLPLSFQQNNTRWSIGAQIKRALSKHFTATLGYRYSRQEANLPDSEFIENRVFGRINYLYQ